MKRKLAIVIAIMLIVESFSFSPVLADNSVSEDKSDIQTTLIEEGASEEASGEKNDAAEQNQSSDEKADVDSAVNEGDNAAKTVEPASGDLSESDSEESDGSTSDDKEVIETKSDELHDELKNEPQDNKPDPGKSTDNQTNNEEVSDNTADQTGKGNDQVKPDSKQSNKDDSINENPNAASGNKVSENIVTISVNDTNPDENSPSSNSAPFLQSMTVDGIKVTVSADKGVFPADSKLSVKKVSMATKKSVEEKVEEIRQEDVNVAVSYTFDIKVLDNKGNELQPSENDKVTVSFTTAEVADNNLQTDVYHVSDDGGEVEKLETEEKEDVASAETEGFSFYTVEFTYNNLQYIMPGDISISLNSILKSVGLSGDVSAVECSDEELFSASNDDGEWIITAHQAFTSKEWMKVTINDVMYELTVTDSATDSGKCGKNLTWQYSDGTLTIKGSGAMYDYTNSDSIPWSKYRTEIGKIVIESGVTRIGNYAFNRCGELFSGIWSISIPTGVVSIGQYAFEQVNLSGGIKFPDSLKSIERDAFAFSDIQHQISFPKGLSSIGDSAFCGCDFGLPNGNPNVCTSTITLPDNAVVANNAFAMSDIESIYFGTNTRLGDLEDEVLNGCDYLKSIEVHPSNSTLKSYNGDLYTKDMTTLLRYSPAKEGTEYRGPNGLRNVMRNAFEMSKQLKTIIIPEGTQYIYIYSFSDCVSVTSLTIPRSLGILGDYLFDSHYSGSTFNLKDVYYGGNEDEWNALIKYMDKSKNKVLFDATIHFGTSSVTSISLDYTGYEMVPGEGAQLTATVKPSNAPDKTVIWSSSNTAVATVNEVGYVKAVNPGEAIITAKTRSGGKTATCKVKVHSTDKVGAFVTRMYTVVLERQPDAEGLAYWTQQLKNGNETGASLMSLFFLGDELTNKHLSNRKYVQLAYQGALGRNPDAEGTAYWVDALDSGTSPQFLVCGCVASQEFNDMCASYGIKAGSISVSEERDKNLGVTKFVSRLYTKALGRNYDTSGLNYWCGIINANPSRDNVIQVAMDGCFHSQEFLNKNLNNRDFVTVAYRTFLGREADLEGYNYWLGQLAGGMSRDEMIRNCAYSQEFSNIMASYGL